MSSKQHAEVRGMAITNLSTYNVKDSTVPMSTTAASPAAQPNARNAKGKERIPAPTDELMRVTTLERAVPSGSAMPPPPPLSPLPLKGRSLGRLPGQLYAMLVLRQPNRRDGGL